MFFTGDPTSRRRVDLGGRSSKERDRQVLLEQARVERKRRLALRQQTYAAIKIQKYFRGRRVAKLERSRIREDFCRTFGDRCQNADQHSFGADSEFLPQLLLFFSARNNGDVAILLEACRLLLQFVHNGGNLVSIFSGPDYSLRRPVVETRVKKLVLACMQATYQNRNGFKNHVLSPRCTSSSILLDTVATLINPNLPWACKVVGHLLHQKIFFILRGIILSRMHNVKELDSHSSISSLENILALITLHTVQHSCSCSDNDPKLCFSSQILSIPFLWRHLPYYKQVFLIQGQAKCYIRQLALCFPSHASLLPCDISQEFPGYACLLGNLVEVAGAVFSTPNCSIDTAMDFALVLTNLLEMLPTLKSSAGEGYLEDEMSTDENSKESMDADLEKQIKVAVDSRLFQLLVNALFRDKYLVHLRNKMAPSAEVVEAIGSICAFLHVTFNTLPSERIMTGLAYGTELVLILWNFIKYCEENHTWPHFTRLASYIPSDAPCWLLPLAVFCPVYKYMLTIVDNEEFYEQEKPLSLNDIRFLVVILKQALWQLLWVIPSSSTSSQKAANDLFVDKRLSVETIRHRARVVISELLNQLQDWNNRTSFTSAAEFYALEASNETFVTQALTEGSRASELLKQAPFLVPFTSRVKIFTAQLAASKQRSNAYPPLPRNRFRIRRNRIFEDAFNQLSVLSTEELRGSIRVSFFNEFGVEEAGIDGGGIFKDFMENITQEAFNVQYGLFKETTDHLLYPNPGSGLIHEQHLQYFDFLGSLLGKAMYEGILVDIPLATFFLSKLKQKHNYLNDLPSLDPELYHHLLFLKHYQGDVSELELYFVIINNDYDEQKEEELLPGGKDIRVTKENVITYIHLVANHRLNYQIRHQSSHFLRGFQQLIEKEWIEMFSEHEIQILISGSLESFDVDDLRSSAHYSGGYDENNPVIVMFWEVVKSFSLEYQKKFLKFVTGCSRGPLLGFKYLEPKFCIQRAAPFDATQEDLDRLPTSATCMNLLKLPPYNSLEQMRTKLIYAISADAGFDLS
ncbi:E3 ubiquitin-protein ligase UPL6 [Apostasia shenzhenica]|uniref:HECT-type E3 ubiquitin transferase n=1 Tax=Apostasia shenzhenica TaxID=1088818 RepID=A0A2I0B5D1_9ASPA|nr:E3 ubiquitin-protein ligase UPL6 [Apostasia shenzhenica]